MNSQQFVEHGKAILKFVANNDDNINDLQVLPSLTPGYLTDLIPCNFYFNIWFYYLLNNILILLRIS